MGLVEGGRRWVGSDRECVRKSGYADASRAAASANA